MESKLSQLIERLEKATGKLESLCLGGSGGAVSKSDAGHGREQAGGPALAAFDEVVAGAFSDFLLNSKAIGGLVSEQVLFQIHDIINTPLRIGVYSRKSSPSAKEIQ